MHGVIFHGLERHAVATLGHARWTGVLAGLGHDALMFTPVNPHPDGVLVEIVSGLSAELGMPPEDLLRGFGRFLAPELLDTYRPFVDPTWTLPDLLENLERVIHRAVRVSDPTATPPRLDVTRPSSSEVIVRYTSRRRLCALARGLVEGLAPCYGVDARVDETACMHRGAEACVLRVDVAGP